MAITPKGCIKYRLLGKEKQREMIVSKVESQLEAAIDAQLLEDETRYPHKIRHYIHFYIDDEFAGMNARRYIRNEDDKRHMPLPLTKEERSRVYTSLAEKYQTLGWYVTGLSENWDGRNMHIEMTLGNPYAI
ncbi:MAG: hypothetical protein PHO02_02955 [Candidatus Nanoarchaeia archaeon]|nr:hypothetical protein [Candidatus Nanoarchaeia archaeon]